MELKSPKYGYLLWIPIQTKQRQSWSFNWNQNIGCSAVYYLTKFERNWFTHVLTQTSVYVCVCTWACFFMTQTKIISIEIFFWKDKPISSKSVPIFFFFLSKWELFEKLMKSFCFLTLLWLWLKGHGHSDLHQNIQTNGDYHDTELERNLFIDLWMHTTLPIFFLTWPVTQHSFSFIRYLSLHHIRVFNLNCYSTISNFILINWKLCRKMNQQYFFSTDLLTFSEGQGLWKW